MKANIKFKDENLNEIIKVIKENYERFNTCSMSVKTDNWTEFETDPVSFIEPDYDQQVIIKLKFSY